MGRDRSVPCAGSLKLSTSESYRHGPTMFSFLLILIHSTSWTSAHSMSRCSTFPESSASCHTATCRAPKRTRLWALHSSAGVNSSSLFRAGIRHWHLPHIRLFWLAFVRHFRLSVCSMNTPPKHARWQRTRRERRGCDRCVPWAGSLPWVARHHHTMNEFAPVTLLVGICLCTICALFGPKGAPPRENLRPRCNQRCDGGNRSR
jgi:hypothetical protein